MSEFEKQNLPCDDYMSLKQDWANQLRQLGYHQTWGEDGYGWQSAAGGPVQSTYEAWSDATGTPDDLKLGVTKEPPAPTYRKPF